MHAPVRWVLERCSAEGSLGHWARKYGACVVYYVFCTVRESTLEIPPGLQECFAFPHRAMS